MVYVYEDQNKYYEKIKEKKNAKCMEKYYKNNVKCVCGLREKSKDHEHSSKHNEYLFKEKLKIHLGHGFMIKMTIPIIIQRLKRQ